MKQDKNQNRSKEILLLFLGVLIIVCIGILVCSQKKESKREQYSHELEKPSISVLQKLPTLCFKNQAGNDVKIEGAAVNVLIYWASWCPHCVDGFREMDGLIEQIETEGANVYLVNKLDEVKESKEQALTFLKEQGIDKETLFDKDCAIYEEIGLHMIPTVIVLNNENIVMSVSEGRVPNTDEIRAMIEEAKTGKSKRMAEVIEKTLENEKGGIRTNYLEGTGEIPSGSDVLSESQGAFMEYAAVAENKELFDEIWSFEKSFLLENGLCPWVITEEKETNVNALVDDLRIAKALHIAQQNWQGYSEDYSKYIDAIWEFNTQDEHLVDYYDTAYEVKAERFTLCYGDLNTLQLLAQDDRRFQELYDNTLMVMKQGVISEKFPLYHSYYDYQKGRYKSKDLNMSEAFTTLLHLAEVGELPDEAIQWIDEQLEQGCIYAIYNSKGEATKAGRYESTAVYALAAMTALESGREDVAYKALQKMEQFKINDTTRIVNGVFGGRDGEGIYSFDQMMALQAYQSFERKLQ